VPQYELIRCPICIYVISALQLLVGASALVAQVRTAAMVGTVRDATAGVLPSAVVTIENRGTHDIRTAPVTSSGEYVFADLPIGCYSLRVEAIGFRTFAVAEITLAAADRVRQDDYMEIGSVSESAEVTAQSAALQTDTATVATLVTQQDSAWFNTACFVGQPLHTAGTSGLAILRGPLLRHVDVSLFKEFPVEERIRLQFRAEVHNITNTPNFTNPSAALGSPSFGTISSTVLNANPRRFQFALKLLF
jgi:hypothetical protein